MKNVFKILILLVVVLSGSSIFAQTNKSFTSDKDTLDIAFEEDTLVTSTIQDTLATTHTAKDSITTKQDGINVTTDSTLYYRLILQYRDSVRHDLKRTFNKDAFKFEHDYYREKFKQPWIGDILGDILKNILSK
jgi:hypothetical protein